MSSGFAAAGVRGIATGEQLLAAGAIGLCELMRGEFVMMSPAGFEHGVVTLGNDAVMLTSIVVPGLGAVLADIFPPIDRR